MSLVLCFILVLSLSLYLNGTTTTNTVYDIQNDTKSQIQSEQEFGSDYNLPNVLRDEMDNRVYGYGFDVTRYGNLYLISTPNYPGYPPDSYGEADIIITKQETLIFKISYIDLNKKHNNIIKSDSHYLHDSLSMQRKGNGEIKDLSSSTSAYDYLQFVNESVRLIFNGKYGQPDTFDGGFKLKFIVVKKYQEPQQADIDLYHCSTEHYQAFAPLIECDGRRDCWLGEDESMCRTPYHSEACGLGKVDAGDSCWQVSSGRYNWLTASRECSNQGAKLVALPFPEKMTFAYQVLDTLGFLESSFLKAFDHYLPVSLTKITIDTHQVHLESIYSGMWWWMNETISYNYSVYDDQTSCGYLRLDDFVLESMSCDYAPNNNFFDAIVCQFYKSDFQPTIKRHIKLKDLYDMISIPSGLTCNEHLTREFLNCDKKGPCSLHYKSSCTMRKGNPKFENEVKQQEIELFDQSLYRKTQKNFYNFVCHDEDDIIPFSFVCDHYPQCSDRSDEDFCNYNPCIPPMISCVTSAQCITHHQFCDNVWDCIYGDDEKQCTKGETLIPPCTSTFCRVDLRGRQKTSNPYTLTDLESSDECPETHFSCHDGLCLPVNLRCNTIPDCVGHEDEVGCQRLFNCPGYYR